MVNVQEQALGIKKFRQNQAIFCKHTAVYRTLKKHIVVAAEQVFLSSLVDQLTRFGQVSALTMLKHMFSTYGVIDEIDLEENTVNMMGTSG